MNHSLPRSIAVALLVLTNWVALVSAQTGPAFEVASIKASDSGDRTPARIQFLPGGRVVATNLPLIILIADAWNIPFQGPRFTYPPEIVRDRYYVQAKAGESAIPAALSTQARDAQMRLMLQALLTERFRLRLAHETKVLPVYALTAARAGAGPPRAKIEEKDCSVQTMPNGGPPADPSIDGGIVCHRLWGGTNTGLQGAAVSMADLALYLDGTDDRPVIDNTGLTGLFSINTAKFQRTDSAPLGAGADLPTLFGVLGQMGLELKPQTAAVEVFRIEHIEKPSAN